MAAHKAPPGLELRHTLKGHSNAIYSLAWSPDGRLLASAGSRDRKLILWDTNKGGAVRTLETGGGRTFGVSWAPDGMAIGTVRENGVVYVVDATTGKATQVGRHSGWAIGVAWHPTEDLLASLGHDSRVKLWRASTGDHLGEFPIGDGYGSGGLAWSPEGDLLAAGLGGSVAIARIGESASKLELEIEPLSVDAAVSALAWTSDGARLLLANGEAIGIFDVRSRTLAQELEGHTSQILALVVSTDGRLIASKSEREVCLWRTDNGQRVATLTEFSSGQWIRALAFHPREPLLATLGRGVRASACGRSNKHG